MTFFNCPERNSLGQGFRSTASLFLSRRFISQSKILHGDSWPLLRRQLPRLRMSPSHSLFLFLHFSFLVLIDLFVRMWQVARTSAVSFGVVYGSLKLSYLKVYNSMLVLFFFSPIGCRFCCLFDRDSIISIDYGMIIIYISIPP